MLDPSTPEPDPERIRETLARVADGSAEAADELFPIVYDELRKLAASRMRRERVNHTLRPTALVHEVYAKISGQTDAEVKSIRIERDLSDPARLLNDLADEGLDFSAILGERAPVAAVAAPAVSASTAASDAGSADEDEHDQADEPAFDSDDEEVDDDA